MQQFCVVNETNNLKEVVLGVLDMTVSKPNILGVYDPKSKENLVEGNYPKNEEIIRALTTLEELFIEYGITVRRPKNLAINQVFVRDLGFVIDDYFIKSNMISFREKEIEGLDQILAKKTKDKIIDLPEDVKIEGGDVILYENYIFVGYTKNDFFDKYLTARTNENALVFLQNRFPNKIVKGFELHKSDDNPYENILHLDCCFQPVGSHKAILYKEAFKHERDYNFLVKIFKKNNIFDLNKKEMYAMYSNVVSISPTVVVSDKTFTRLNNWLKDNGLIVRELSFDAVSKQSGLFHCATLPLLRV